MELIKVYRKFKIWKTNEENYSGYTIELPGNHYCTIRTGRSLSHTFRIINDLLRV